MSARTLESYGAPASLPTAADKRRFDGIDEKVMRRLADGKQHDRRELLVLTHGAAVNSAIARCRRKYGAKIVCGRGENRSYLYRLADPGSYSDE